jgi:hypothetical protein
MSCRVNNYVTRVDIDKYSILLMLHFDNYSTIHT